MKNALNYKKPIFWIIIIAVIVCIAVSVFFLTSPKDDTDTSSEQSDETSSATEEIGTKTEFEEYYFDAYLTEYECTVFPEPMTTFTAKTQEELDRIRSHTGDEGFLEFADSLPDDFFDTKMLIFAYSWLTPSTVIDITDVQLYEARVSMNVTYEQVSDTQNSYTRLIAAAVNKTDAGGYEQYTTEHTALEDVYEFRKENRIDFTEYVFGGEIRYTSSFSTPGINSAIAITSRNELNDFEANYEYLSIGEGLSLASFSSGLPDDYFDHKVLIIIPSAMPVSENGEDSRITAVYSDEDYLMVCVDVNLQAMVQSDSENRIFAVEIDRSDIQYGAKIRCFADHLEYGNGIAFELHESLYTVSVVDGSYDCGYVPGSDTDYEEPACFSVIQTADELMEYMKLCNEDIYSNRMYQVRKNADSYLENNMLIFIHTYRKDSTVFDLTVYKSGDALDSMKLTVDNSADELIPSEECIIVVHLQKMPVSERFSMIVEPTE